MRASVATAIKRLVLVTCTSMVLAVIAVSVDARAAESQIEHPALATNSLADGDQPYCFSCWAGAEVGCAEGQHRDNIHSGPYYFKDYDHHQGCVLSLDPVYPCGEHGWCSFGDELNDEADLLLQRDDLRGLTKLISENSTKLTVDVGRKQLIVVGCDGKPYSRLDLTKAQVSALESPKTQH